MTAPGWAPPAPDRLRPELDVLVEQVQAVIADQMQRLPPGEVPRTEAQRREVVDRLLDAALRSYAQAAITSGEPGLDGSSRALVVRRVRDALLALGPLQPLLDDPFMENIDLVGDGVFVQYTDGRRAQLPALFGSDEALEEWVRQVALNSGGDERRFDRGSPSVSVPLPGGGRLFAVMAVAARPSVSIRKFATERWDLPHLVTEKRTVSPGMAALFSAIVRARLNVVISGGTNLGKTTFLQVLAREIPAFERLVTIEDAYELGLHTDPAHPNTVALQARTANVEGAGAVDLAELVRWGLRMNPDRVIVGEVRGHEVIPMCNAMSQGNDGSLCTIHASSSEQAFYRMATYAAQGPAPLGFDATAMLVGGAVHFVIQLAWAPDGRRVVTSVREVTGFDGQRVTSNEVYRPGPDRRGRHVVPLRDQTLHALLAVGFDPTVLDADREGWS